MNSGIEDVGGYPRVVGGCEPHVVEVGGYSRSEWGPGTATIGGYSHTTGQS